MSNKPWWLILFLNVLLIDVLLAGIVMAWSWIAADFSVVSMSNRFFICGIAVIVIGVFGIHGYKTYLGNFSMTYSQSVSDMNTAERTSLMMKDLLRGYGFSIVMFIAGGLAILAAVLVS
ncbi:MAG: hypothetical protein L6Q26_07310 [Anaerolineales bacterium]|nr:hypothetical protein [Anaerolineales bacterium]NUQ83583.1 hypothetical protein [Anaerolineales bacterium]